MVPACSMMMTVEKTGLRIELNFVTILTVSVIMTQKIIAQTCLMIAYGASCSVLMVVFILPAILLLLDRIIIRKKKGER